MGQMVPLWEEAGAQEENPRTAPTGAIAADGTESLRTPPQVARVMIDSDLPHLDRLFDYRIPPKILEQAASVGQEIGPGQMVRVRFAGRLVNGWIAEVAHRSSFDGKLAPLSRLLTDAPVVSRQMFQLASHLGQRYAAPAVTLLKAMLPARHAAAEKKTLTQLAAAGFHLDFDGSDRTFEPHPADPVQTASYWESVPQGKDFLSHLQAGETVRVMWNTAPGIYPAWGENAAALTAAVAAALASGKSVIVVAPTSNQVEDFKRRLGQLVEPDEIATHLPQDSACARWKTFLRERAGAVRLVIGTRSAVWAPVPTLGAIFVADCSDDRMREPQAPYTTVLDVAVRRSHLQRASLVAFGPSTSVAQAGLLASKWARPLGLTLPQLREQSARIEVFDQQERERYGSAGQGNLPAQIQSRIRQTLQAGEGPVLVHVPHRGWAATVVCQRCQVSARCPGCGGPLAADRAGQLQCGWCGNHPTWKCPECEGRTWSGRRVGSGRTAQELARAFDEFEVVLSDAEHGIVSHLPQRSALVVATPDSEPIAEDGYALAVVLNAGAIANRTELWAPQEAMRRWLNVHSLVRPSGQLVVVGLEDLTLAGLLVRRDGAAFARHLLTERQELGFYPAATIVALEGDGEDVEEMLTQVELPPDAELIGVVPMVGRDTPQRAGKAPTRALLRTPNCGGPQLVERIWQVQQTRSKSHAGLVTVHLNPPSLV